jgi:hypothetical protein
MGARRLPIVYRHAKTEYARALTETGKTTDWRGARFWFAYAR